MVLKIDAKKKFSTRSDRVKCVDFHPTEPWILAGMYNGVVNIWNYHTMALEKSFDVSSLPVRSAVFVPRKEWVIAGADDLTIRVYNYSTMEKVRHFEAHVDYLRRLVVHPSLPLLLSCADDRTIKLWNWEQDWQCVMVYDGHGHYVMDVSFNPKDPNTFASCSMDTTVKVWGLSSPVPNFTLEGHAKCVNTVSYFAGGDKPYLISGSDDMTVKVWDYQNKTCVHTMEGHTHNVTSAMFHNSLPIILSASEDGTIRVWNSTTYKLEKTLNYGMDRAWHLAQLGGTSRVAIGFDAGCMVLKLAREVPAVSMAAGGKVLWAVQNEIQAVNVRSVADSDLVDGERLPLAGKLMGTFEYYPQTVSHNADGRFVAVSGDGEWVISTALALRSKCFGPGFDFVWAADKGDSYAVREGTSVVKLFRQFQELLQIRPSFAVEGLFGGVLLGVRSGRFVSFYSWTSGELVRRVDVVPRAVYWSENGVSFAVCCDTGFFILRYHPEALAAVPSGTPLSEEGVEAAFELQYEVSERVRTGTWVGDCFIYTTMANRLNYCTGGESFTIAHLDRPMYMLGYIPANSRIYLADKMRNVVTYRLDLSILHFQTAIMRGDLETASQLLPRIPDEHRTKVAHFLVAQGHTELALQVTRDPDHRFELAIQLGRLDTAYEIASARGAQAGGTSSSQDHKWKQLADLALAECRFELAEDCMKQAADVQGLLLLYTSLGDGEGMAELAELAARRSQMNVAFLCHFLLGDVVPAMDALIASGRIPEAAFFARSYAPSQMSRVVKLWKEQCAADAAALVSNGAQGKAATVQAIPASRRGELLADPADYENLFPDLELALRAEKMLGATERRAPVPAFMYPAMTAGADKRGDVLAMAREWVEPAAGATSSERPPSERPPSERPPSERTPPRQTTPPERVPSQTTTPVPVAVSPVPRSPSPVVEPEIDALPVAEQEERAALEEEQTRPLDELSSPSVSRSSASSFMIPDPATLNLDDTPGWDE